MMEKMGYQQGKGLGKNAQGLSSALHVERVGPRGGAIINPDSATVTKGYLAFV